VKLALGEPDGHLQGRTATGPAITGLVNQTNPDTRLREGSIQHLLQLAHGTLAHRLLIDSNPSAIDGDRNVADVGGANGDGRLCERSSVQFTVREPCASYGPEPDGPPKKRDLGQIG
jgi:hypothetical protein